MYEVDLSQVAGVVRAQSLQVDFGKERRQCHVRGGLLAVAVLDALLVQELNLVQARQEADELQVLLQFPIFLCGMEVNGKGGGKNEILGPVNWAWVGKNSESSLRLQRGAHFFTENQDDQRF